MNNPLEDKARKILSLYVVAVGNNDKARITYFEDKLMALIDDYGLECRQETEKAFGGCKKCYGKGYATVIRGTAGYADFGGEGFVAPPTTKIRYCSCDRGKQLKELNPEEEL